MINCALKGAVFDLDGVITKTAIIHFQAWKLVFDEYLHIREKRNGEDFNEFTYDGSYLPYVDGKPRYDGARDFLKSRGIALPLGEPGDSSEQETICGIGNKKNKKFLELVKEKGAEVYSSTIQLIKEFKKAGVKIGVVSSSKSCKKILEAAHIEDLFETRVDGISLVALGLKGKPAEDMFVKAADNLLVMPQDSLVAEDAVAGVEAGRNGGFGLVVGVARKNPPKELFCSGADIVVKDLSEISIDWIERWFQKYPQPLFEYWERSFKKLPAANNFIDSQESRAAINPHYFRPAKSFFIKNKKPAFFLDYDGTLTAIVERPQLAGISEEMRNVLRRLIERFTVAIVSGRLREDVEHLVGIENIFYAGSHGFDIRGPNFSLILPEAENTVPLINEVINKLKNKLSSIKGILIEEKKFSAAVHYRLVREEDLPKIKDFVENIIKENSCLRLMQGKKVFEILPAISWNKGKAVRWIMQALNISWQSSSVIYIGDDTTDEDAFRILRTRGLGILVSAEQKPSFADFCLSAPQEVKKLFELIIQPGFCISKIRPKGSPFF